MSKLDASAWLQAAVLALVDLGFATAAWTIEDYLPAVWYDEASRTALADGLRRRAMRTATIHPVEVTRARLLTAAILNATEE